MTLAAACAVVAITAAAGAAQAPQKTVLVLYAARRDAPAPASIEPVLLRVLGDGLGGHLDYYPEFLDLARFPDADYLQVTQRFLRDKYKGQRFDAIVATGERPLAFATRLRDDVLFRGTPIVFFAAANPGIIPNATGVIARFSMTDALGSALTLLPDTTRVAIVGGASSFDRGYEGSAREQFKRFESRVAFDYLIGLPLAQLLRRLATLPPHSIVFFLSLAEDGDGQKFLPNERLDQVSAAASVPSFSWLTATLDHGVVGGRMHSIDVLASNLAALTLRVLQGEHPDAIPVADVDWNVSQYDWRQIQRWGIDEARLPAGSTILFRQLSAWQLYRPYIVGGVLLVLSQTTFIVALLVQRTRRRAAEAEKEELMRQLQGLAGRLIAARESERARIARDLHDDVSQQLAGLAIGLSGLRRRVDARPDQAQLTGDVSSLQQRTVVIAEQVRHLSHDLHPSVLQHAGLVAALSAHCAEVRSQRSINVSFSAEGDFGNADPQAALCLYRVAQEALRNVVTHAQARHAEVRLVRLDDSAQLTVVDDGQGFDIAVAREMSPGLGLVSINERVRSAGGSVNISTERQAGTQVRVQVPIARRAAAGASEEPRRA